MAHLVFAGTFAVRLWALVRLTQSSLLLPTRGDMHFYNDWAREVLQGHFTQPLAFYGLPGYAYLLALLYKLFGQNPFLPGLLQAAGDAGVSALLYHICVGIFTGVGSTSCTNARFIGLIAALGWAFFVPDQAYSVVLMPTALFVFAFWFVVWRVARRNEPPSAIEGFLLASLIGITATAVATIFAVVPLILGAFIFKQEKNNNRFWRVLSGRLSLLCVGLAFGTSPCWIHNYFVAKDPVLLSAHSGINFWIGNNPEANGYPRFPPGLRAGQAAMLQDSITQAETAARRPLKHAEVSAYWSNKAKTYVAGHISDWFKLIARKLRNFWSAFQYDDLSIITSLREQNVILPGLSFGIVAAFAIPGIIFGWRRAPRSRWILAAVLLSMFALLAVFITERYRLVAVPGLLIFAAFGLSIFWQGLRTTQFRAVVIYVFLLIAAATIVAWPQRNPSLWALDAYNSGWQALESNDFSVAEKKLAMAYAYVPTNAETNFALGNLRLAQNQSEDAKSFYRATLQIDPHHKGALNNLGVINLEEANFEQAREFFEKALVQAPRDAKAHYLLAKTFYAENNQPAARRAIGLAISLNPNQREFSDLKGKIDAMPPK